MAQNPLLSKENLHNKLLEHYTAKGYKENRIINKEQLKKFWILEEEVDPTFDHEFYVTEYPDTVEFYAHWQHISLRERLFNHYEKFGKIEGRYKNKEQKYIKKSDQSHISDIIPLSSLKNIPNKLECIVLLITDIEVKNGLYNQLSDRLSGHTTRKEAKRIDFKIIVNNIADSNSIDITSLQNLFRNIEIINLNLDPEDDLYIRDNRKIEKTPRYGRKSGPNVMFYRALDICKNYNTTLFLETDCFFRESWLSKLKDFINSANSFWVSGATYDGVVPTKAGSELSTHINGGIGLYATGNKSFQIFITQTELFLVEAIKNGLVGLAYDVSIKMYIDHITNSNTAKVEDILVCKFINKHYLSNKIIGNFSTTKDSIIDLEQIANLYNYYIIHKK